MATKIGESTAHFRWCRFDLALQLRLGSPLVPRARAEQVSSGDSPIVESRWTAGATSEWNAGTNRAVSRLVDPPENVNVYAAQSDIDLNRTLGGPYVSDKTLAGFEIVIH